MTDLQPPPVVPEIVSAGEDLLFAQPGDLRSPAPGRLYGAAVVQSRLRMNLGRAAALASVAAGGAYLVWRISTLPGTGALGVVFWVAEAVNFLALALTLALVWRVLRRPSPPPLAGATLDVFITVCGEPRAMVEETLKAALAIAHPHRTWLLNDGLVAGKPNFEQIEALAESYGVSCFTRTQGALGKAANLNHALRRTHGDYIAVIDADHVAAEDFADQTLGYFSDDRVGFVATPQQFSGETTDALNNRELFFYRVLQPAKDAGNSAFSCGNATILRRAALDSIGGFSEWNLVEDLHTSYRLHAQGWTSAYHAGAVTVGTAPRTFAALAEQRLTWATDSVRLLFWDNPFTKRGLTLRQRLHYCHTTSFYLVASTQVLFLFGPALWIGWGVPVMQFRSVGEYLTHSLPFYGSVIAFFVVHVGARGTLRIAQQQLSLSPVYLYAVLRAAVRAPRWSTVTEKAREKRVSRLILPTALATGLSIGTLVVSAVERSGRVTLAGVWGAWFAFTMVGAISAVTVDERICQALRLFMRAVIIAGVVALFVPIESSLQSHDRRLAEGGSRPVAPTMPQKLMPPRDGAYIGVFNADALRSPRRLAEWNRRHRTRAHIVNSYQQWFNDDRRFRADRAGMVAAEGGVLMVTWEPWAKPPGALHDVEQPRARLQRVAAGRYDPYVRRWARAAAAYRKPLLLRFMHEMNGDWYPWSVGHNGNTGRSFIRAWRHVHNVFTRAGATNVSWVWTVNSFAGLRRSNATIRSYYPGRRYVDWVSATGFNWGDSHEWNAWREVDTIYRSTYRALRSFRKPIMFSEIGTVDDGGDGDRWVRKTLTRLRRGFRRVKAVVWFDERYDATTDFRLRRGQAAAFSSTLRDSAYWRPRLRVRSAASD